MASPRTPDGGSKSISCSFRNCTNSRINQAHLSYHRFPINDKERCDSWIKNSGNPELAGLMRSHLQLRVVCERHFRREDFRDSTAIKKYLLWHVIPQPWNSKHVPLQNSIKQQPKSKPVAQVTPPVEARVLPKRASSQIALKQIHSIAGELGDEPETLEIISDDDDIPLVNNVRNINYSQTQNKIHIQKPQVQHKVQPVQIKIQLQPKQQQQQQVQPQPAKKYKVSQRKSEDDRDILVFKHLATKQNSPLNLEVWCDEPSLIQSNHQKKLQKEYDTMMGNIRALLSASSAEVIYEGSSFSAFHMEGPPTLMNVVNQPTTNQIIQSQQKNKSITITKTTVPVVKNVTPSKPTETNAGAAAAAAASPNNAFSIVLDPRSGQVVGTVTPATQNTTLLKATLSTDNRKRRRPAGPIVQTAPAPKVPKIVPVGNSAAAQVPPPLVSLRAQESNAVGGIQPNGSNIMTVDLTSDDGKADSKEVSFNKLQGKTFPSLVVVARPHLRVPTVASPERRAQLDAKVKSVLMYPPTKFTEWLLQQGLIKSEQTCTNHQMNSLKLGMYSDVSKFPYSGGYVRISECCPQKFISVFLGSIFESSPHPPSVILKLVYHWSCQTNVQNVTQWVKVENLYVKGINTWLRAICTVALHTHVPQLGGPGVKVEIGVISLGTTSQDGNQKQVKVEVLGILETDTKRIRLRAVEPLAENERNYRKRFSNILEPLSPWVHPDSVIVTDMTVDKSTLHTMGFLNIQQTSSGANHTIMDYLRRIVPRMFQNTLSLLSRKIIQQFLDELVWREWFGTTAADAFDSILAHMSEQTKAETGQSLIIRMNRVANNPFKNWSIATYNMPQPQKQTPIIEVKKQRRKQTIQRSNSPVELLRPVLKPPMPEGVPQMVPLENYYYGTITGINKLGNVYFSVKCHICKKNFNNNISLMKDYFGHAHESHCLHQCHYCLAGVDSKDSLELHIALEHPLQTQTPHDVICIICGARFATGYLLGKHMSNHHVASELPYQCGSCSFRCSSHRQAIDHFHTAHKNQGVLQCPFCLKSITVVNHMGRSMPQHLNNFLIHLQKHQNKGVVKKCHRCQLWFIQKEGLRDHQKMHESQSRRKGMKPLALPEHQCLMVPRSLSDENSTQNELQIPFPEEEEEELNIAELKFDVPDTANCKECTKKLGNNHFESVLACENDDCSYVTCCKKAMKAHLDVCKSIKLTVPMMKLSFDLFCVCGHKDNDGNSMAKHLAFCERNSAYPSAEAAKKATVTHSMLDVLGLVRRPEETVSGGGNTNEDISKRPPQTSKRTKREKKPEEVKKEVQEAMEVDSEVASNKSKKIDEPATKKTGKDVDDAEVEKINKKRKRRNEGDEESSKGDSESPTGIAKKSKEKGGESDDVEARKDGKVTDKASAENEDLETSSEKDDAKTEAEKGDNKAASEKDTEIEKDDVEAASEKDDAVTVPEKDEAEAVSKKGDAEASSEKSDAKTTSEKDDDAETVSEKDDVEAVSDKDDAEKVSEKADADAASEKDCADAESDKDDAEIVSEKDDVESRSEKDDAASEKDDKEDAASEKEDTASEKEDGSSAKEDVASEKDDAASSKEDAASEKEDDNGEVAEESMENPVNDDADEPMEGDDESSQDKATEDISDAEETPTISTLLDDDVLNPLDDLAKTFTQESHPLDNLAVRQTVDEIAQEILNSAEHPVDNNLDLQMPSIDDIPMTDGEVAGLIDNMMDAQECRNKELSQITAN